MPRRTPTIIFQSDIACDVAIFTVTHCIRPSTLHGGRCDVCGSVGLLLLLVSPLTSGFVRNTELMPVVLVDVVLVDVVLVVVVLVLVVLVDVVLGSCWSCL